MSPSKKKLLSIVVPVFNEEKNIEPLHHAVQSVMSSLSDRYNFELIFTDNHSTDRTYEKLEHLCRQDQRIRVLRFSRNMGYQRSIYTGYIHAKGDAAIQLDGDLQDPPELIPELVRLWEAGHQVVYGVRRSRKEAWGLNFLRRAFYRLINFLSEDSLPLDAGDFRLIDRCVIEELKKLEDRQPYLRGAFAAMGFSQIGLPYDRLERRWGESKFSWGDMFGLAVDGILNHSVVPLRLATYLGLVVALLMVLGQVGYLVARLFFGQDWPAGFATLVLLILLSISLNALFLGIIGEYLGRIYKQVKGRPTTIIEREINPSGFHSRT